MAAQGCRVKWGGPIVRPFVHICPSGKQKFDDRQVTAARSVVQDTDVASGAVRQVRQLRVGIQQHCNTSGIPGKYGSKHLLRGSRHARNTFSSPDDDGPFPAYPDTHSLYV
jgi:hypothetical protein